MLSPRRGPTTGRSSWSSPRFAGCVANDAGADALSDWKRDEEDICSMVCSELVAYFVQWVFRILAKCLIPNPGFS